MLLQPGMRIGRIRVDALLGSGGMGERTAVLGRPALTTDDSRTSAGSRRP